MNFKLVVNLIFAFERTLPAAQENNVAEIYCIRPIFNNFVVNFLDSQFIFCIRFAILKAI
jgi:hypothetical protein